MNKTRNYFLAEIKHNELASKILNYVELLLLLDVFQLISAFFSLVRIPIAIASSAIGLKNRGKTARIKKFESIIKKKRGKK